MYKVFKDALKVVGSAISLILEFLVLVLVPTFKAAAFCLLLLMLWTPIAIIQGYVLLMLWTWFLVPAGFHVLTLGSAIGVSLIINLLTAHFTNVASEKDAFDLCGFWLLFQALIYCAGFVIKSGMGILW